MRAASEDARRIAEAIDLARRCTPSERAFSVGAVIVAPDGETIATGHSRETGPSAHAEQVALDKAATAGADLRGATLYSSMEPCSVRLSGRPPCTGRIAAARISRVVYAMAEPPLFVVCDGANELRLHGVEVVQLADLAAAAQEVNRHLLPQ